MNLNELPQFKAIHAIVFGPPKSGKTRLVGELAEHGFSLKWFDLENGRKVLYQLSEKARERIEIFAIPDTKDFPIAAETLAIVLKGRSTRICWEHGKVSCAICLKTSPTAFNEINLSSLKEDEILVIDSSTQWSNSIMSHIGRDKDDLWRPEWDHYRTQGSMLDRALTSIQNGQFNCILISHEMSLKMEDGREKLVPIAGTTNFSRNTAKYFDEVVYCEVKNRGHRVGSSTLYAPDILTGSRSGISIEKESELSLIKMFKERGEQRIDPAKAMLESVKKEIGK